jgi:cytochrome P450
LPRDVVKDFEFGGYQVREGDEVFVAATATHYNSTFYKDPEKFDIDRFSPPRNEHKAAGAYAPFGIGAHRCLGADMGELQSMIVVATMLRYLKLETHPKNYDLKIVCKPLRRPDPKFRIKVVGRRFPN